MTRRYRLPLFTACEPCTLLEEACPEPGCWGAAGHLGLHAAPGARWTTKGGNSSRATT